MKFKMNTNWLAMISGKSQFKKQSWVQNKLTDSKVETVQPEGETIENQLVIDDVLQNSHL